MTRMVGQAFVWGIYWVLFYGPLFGAQPDETSHADWPFQAATRPPLPEVRDRSWPQNPVDTFVLARLEAQDLAPNSPADRRTLLRRVTLDLTGLPPTLQQQQAFLKDSAPGAYQRAVDRLLASPQFGERWAQHWLDVVRYAETDGFKSDNLRPSAFRYRDYVIRSVNRDLPYDQFVRQQIAGDQLDPENPQALIATGVNRLYPDEDNAANLFQRRQEILNDITETIGLAFMGLTMGCAQCHDHKFDDILQTDFYRLQAFFSPMVEWNDAPAAPPEVVQRYRQQLEQWETATADLRREMDELTAAERRKSNEYNLEKFRPEIQECYTKPAEERTALEEQIARMVAKQLAWRFDKNALPKDKLERYEQLEKELARFDDLRPDPLPTAMAIADLNREPPPTYLLDGGDWRKPLESLAPGFPEFLEGTTRPVSLQRDDTPLADSVSGEHAVAARRADLAYWLTAADHPLTARVIVNRLWQHHFGQGIVASPNDFGVMGSPPSHRELLDWLAVELIESGWSLKHIHRLLVTSATYQQSSEVRPSDPLHQRALTCDSENLLLWHARRWRLEGEAIRDAMARIAGNLNGQMFGPSVHPPLPDGLSTRYAWSPDPDQSSHFRRSIYVLAKRNMRFPLFDAFDLPDMHNSCGQRMVTITAPQALLMLNSRYTRTQAEQWAMRLCRQWPGDTRGMIEAAYQEAYCRLPDEQEIVASEQFLQRQSSLVEDDPHAPDRAQPVQQAAAADFCHALLNSNEFIFVD